MSYEIKVLPLAALRPDPNNPRRDFGDLDALAEEFDLNPYDPGEPFEPISGVVDGNVVRLVDGERRYRAMKAAGKVEKCHVRVYDSMDEATACMVMTATDDKKPLAAEKAREAEEAEALRQAARQVAEQIAADAKARVRWVSGKVSGGRCAARHVASALEGMADDFFLEKAEAWEAVFLYEPEETDPPAFQMTDSLYLLLAADASSGMLGALRNNLTRMRVARGEVDRFAANHAVLPYFELVDAMAEDGYEAEGWQDELLDKLVHTFSPALEGR